VRVRAITRTFDALKQRGEKAFIPFLTAGDPDLTDTVELVKALDRAGSDLIELGIPFSDPLADGPVIQRSSERALRKGYRMADYLEAIRSIRKESPVPMILFSYFNPILQYGLERLARDARASGVDGVLVTDMIPEESAEYCTVLESQDLDTVFLAAPTSSPARLDLIARHTRGFVYVVSRTGVTGTRESLSEMIAPTLARVRASTDLPVAVGFGISKPEHVQAVWRLADGAVVGSAIVQQIENWGSAPDLGGKMEAFCRWLREGPHG